MSININLTQNIIKNTFDVTVINGLDKIFSEFTINSKSTINIPNKQDIVHSEDLTRMFEFVFTVDKDNDKIKLTWPANPLGPQEEKTYTDLPLESQLQSNIFPFDDNKYVNQMMQEHSQQAPLPKPQMLNYINNDQVKELITAGAGVANVQDIKNIIAKYGFASSKVITPDKYDAILNEVKSLPKTK